jgi:tetratricopeptide (TPR) repeat protein
MARGVPAMRHLRAVVLAVLVLDRVATESPGQATSDRVGQRVIMHFGNAPKGRKQAFDDERRGNTLADSDQAIRIDLIASAGSAARGGAGKVERDSDNDPRHADKPTGRRLIVASAYNNRGYDRYSAGDCDKAIADYNEAIRLDPRFALAYNNRGMAWWDKGDRDKALADYNEAIRLDPRFAWPYNNRGNVREDEGEYDKALADYDEAIRLDPRFAWAYSNRGTVWEHLGEYEKALADYNEAIRLDPKDPTAYCNRAWLWATCPDARHRDAKRAVESARKACKLGRWKDAYAIGTLAAAYADAGDFDAALKWQYRAQGLYKDEKDQAEGWQRLALYRQKKPYREEPKAR